jgi:hypothetical protein
MVNSGMELLAAAFIAGTALSAAAGTFAETIFGTTARLDRPFVDSDRILMSLARVLLAGPYFLVGEAAEAHEEGRCGFVTWALSILCAAGWCLCLGIVALEMASQLVEMSISTLDGGNLIYEPL